MRASHAICLISLLVFINGCTPILTATHEGPITQNQGKRTLGSIVDDETIETLAQVNLEKVNPEFKNNHVVVTSFNGTVLLTGQVATEALKNQAGQEARKLQKVKQVYNELEVSSPISYLARSNDSWLTSKIKTKMLANEKVPASRVKVVTENGVVFLMGLVTQQEANEAVNVVRTSYGVQKIVKVFEYIDQG
ncbi:BON domain-containing protein [Endozoicomonas sp. SM1973]|uniref:BON domain-containing protein n=1 Tax=Spartinivicinus marinus TaxID=2994442 RepID=A0A853IDW7_9GAMM|nr:BON domain-containing protein [Spartinivicinus marinus]MCX4028301.1 BON domain-containing protein [Spartinivicinus marinus]NYZ65636.1 BON domain-containing protein [Spartinivicinus marinus]